MNSENNGQSTDELLEELAANSNLNSDAVNRESIEEQQQHQQQNHNNNRQNHQNNGQNNGQNNNNDSGFDMSLIDGEFIVEIMSAFGDTGTHRLGQWLGDKELTPSKAAMTAKQKSALIKLVDKKLSEMNAVPMTTNQAIFYSISAIYGSKLLPGMIIYFTEFMKKTTAKKAEKVEKRGRPRKKPEGDYVEFNDINFSKMTMEQQSEYLKNNM